MVILDKGRSTTQEDNILMQAFSSFTVNGLLSDAKNQWIK